MQSGSVYSGSAPHDLHPSPRRSWSLLAAACAALGLGCVDDGPRPLAYGGDRDGLANGCFVLDAAPPGGRSGRLLVAADDRRRFALQGRAVESAARLFPKPADLGVYLLRDAEGRYLAAGADPPSAGIESRGNRPPSSAQPAPFPIADPARPESQPFSHRKDRLGEIAPLRIQ